MEFSFQETPDSRAETSEPPTYTLIYKAVGEFDDEVVHDYALANTPTMVNRPSGLLYRKDVRRDPAGWGQYLVTVPYGRKEARSVPTGEYTFDFDTTGATVNVKAAKEHIETFPTDGDWHKGAIGVKGDGEVEGVDIVVPALRLTYTFNHPAAEVDETFARTLANATGHTNLSQFQGFDPGELLFIGATGSDGSEAEAKVAYQFIAIANETAVSIGDIEDIAKEGHHVIWIEFKDEVHSDEPVRQPKRVHIERVYDPIDFAATFGWGGP